MNDSKLTFLPDCIRKPSDSSHNIDLARRRAIQNVLGGIAGLLAAPAFSATHPIFGRLTNGESVLQAREKGTPAEWRPAFLSSTQNETLIAIGERMIPGFTQAQVNRLLDLVLSVDSDFHRSNFISSLNAFDGVAQQKHGKLFYLLSAEQRDDVLTVCSNGAQSPAMPAPVDPDDSAPEKTPVTARDHFENLKGWIVAAYYATEQGMRELGWTEDFYFEELPACDHGGEHGHGE